MILHCFLTGCYYSTPIIPFFDYCCCNFPLDRSQKLEDMKWFFRVDEGMVYCLTNRSQIPLGVGSRVHKPRNIGHYLSFCQWLTRWLALFKNTQVSFLTVSRNYCESSRDWSLVVGHRTGLRFIGRVGSRPLHNTIKAHMHVPFSLINFKEHTKTFDCCFVRFYQIFQNDANPVGWGCKIHWLHLCREVRPSTSKCPGYDIKQSDYEIWGMWSTPSLPLLQGPLWPRVVEPNRILCMG